MTTTNPTPEHKQQAREISRSELIARLQDALQVAHREGAASLSAETFAAALSALTTRDTEIREVLDRLQNLPTGDPPCWCRVRWQSGEHDGACEQAQALYAKLQAGG